jgi:hypothetical protein
VLSENDRNGHRKLQFEISFFKGHLLVRQFLHKAGCIQLKFLECGSQVDFYAKFVYLQYDGRDLCYLKYQSVPSNQLRERLV